MLLFTHLSLIAPILKINFRLRVITILCIFHGHWSQTHVSYMGHPFSLMQRTSLGIGHPLLQWLISVLNSSINPHCLNLVSLCVILLTTHSLHEENRVNREIIEIQAKRSERSLSRVVIVSY